MRLNVNRDGEGICLLLIARLFPSKSRNPWTPEEDERLLELYKNIGPNWGKIADEIEGRNGK